MLIAITRNPSAQINRCELTCIKRELIDFEVAARQHDAYCAWLSSCGMEVVTLPASDSYPDSCFVEDAAIVFDGLSVITSTGVASRRGETLAVEQELARHRELSYIRLPATIEGGDVLQIGKKVFVGLS